MKHPIIVATLLGLTGCAETSAPDTTVDPVLGSADSLRSVTERESLRFDAEVSGRFTEDMKFDGYRFVSEQGGQFTVEITQKGTSRGLDTVLWIYARTNAGWERVALDQDSGWGALSKVSMAADNVDVLSGIG